VRSLLWNTELPWLLTSGGDDSYLALWDIRKDSLVTSVRQNVTVFEPSISISCLTSHPSKPFSFLSAHLDNSIIVWDLMGLPEVQLAQLKLIADSSLIEVCTDPHDAMVPENFGKLAGSQSHELVT
jgi:WD40 repeat protein